MSYMWLCQHKTDGSRTGFFIANTENQVVKMLEYHGIRTYFDNEKMKKYPIEDINITKFKELRKEKYWVVIVKDAPEVSNTYYSDLIISSKKETALKLYRSIYMISDSVSDDIYDFIEIVPMERWWGIYYTDEYRGENASKCLDIITAETKEEALGKHIKEKGLVLPNLYCACEEIPERKNFYSWE